MGYIHSDYPYGARRKATKRRYQDNVYIQQALEANTMWPEQSKRLGSGHSGDSTSTLFKQDDPVYSERYIHNSLKE